MQESGQLLLKDYDKINTGDCMKTFTAIIERCPDTQLFVGCIPWFSGAQSQAASLDALHEYLQEALQLLLEDVEPILEGEFVGTQTIMPA
jgi:predicted RNase H-like HicB family nuclease